jgi:hypothetical protein
VLPPQKTNGSLLDHFVSGHIGHKMCPDISLMSQSMTNRGVPDSVAAQMLTLRAAGRSVAEITRTMKILHKNDSGSGWWGITEVTSLLRSAATQKASDCSDMLSCLIKARDTIDGFLLSYLTYDDYMSLPNAKHHAGYVGSSLVVLMWSHPHQLKQHHRFGQTLSWDNTHLTNWLHFKYFDFVAMGPLGFKELITQGIQQIEDAVVMTWIVRHVLMWGTPAGALESVTRQLNVDEDASQLSAIASEGVQCNLDPWHVHCHWVSCGQSMGDDIFPKWLNSMYNIQYDDDIRTRPLVHPLLLQITTALGYSEAAVTSQTIPQGESFKMMRMMRKLLKNWGMWAESSVYHKGFHGETVGCVLAIVAAS